MQEICNESMCTACGACLNVCEKHAISFQENSEGFMMPSINQDICIKCGLCKSVCPANKFNTVYPASFYMAWHKNIDVLKKSSSGGVFTALANYVLKRGGVVIGAYQNCDTHEVSHIVIENESELDKLRLSKYHQSNTKMIYRQIREFLTQKRYVLFSGTACQIAGLLSVLEHWKVMRGEVSEYLITVDVLCHGCTSKKVMDFYICDKEKQFKKKILNFYFRVKTKKVGWQSGGGTRMKLEFSDGSTIIQDKNTDTFFVGFNRYLFLRESCYQCKYCGRERITDFTIADFWGVDPNKVSSKQMNLGISVMCVNSEKANQMLEELSNNLKIERIDPMEAVPYNLAFTKPGDRPKERDSIFQMFEKYGFDRVIKWICKKFYFKQYLKKIIISIIGSKRYYMISQIVKRH